MSWKIDFSSHSPPNLMGKVTKYNIIMGLAPLIGTVLNYSLSQNVVSRPLTSVLWKGMMN